MLQEFNRIVNSESNKIDADELMSVASRLREKQFIFKDGHGQSRTYDVAVNQEAYFTSLFGAFGDEFFVDAHFGYCGILPRTSRPALNQLETIFLLILAKMHDLECRKARSIDGRTQPGEAVLLDEYSKATGREKPKAKDTKDALTRLRRAGVIELGGVNELTEMQEITILPSIMRVVSNTYLDSLEQFSLEHGDPNTDDGQIDIEDFEA